MNDFFLMQHAYLVGQQSNCVSWKVGAVIAKNGRIISTGYNGTPSGHCNCSDHASSRGWLVLRDGNFLLRKEHRDEHRDWSIHNEIHAELNAILFAARNGQSIEGADMFVTVSPCYNCAKAIAQTGIRRLVYNELYDHNPENWDKIMVDSGIEVVYSGIDLGETYLNSNVRSNFNE